MEFCVHLPPFFGIVSPLLVWIEPLCHSHHLQKVKWANAVESAGRQLQFAAVIHVTSLFFDHFDNCF